MTSCTNIIAYYIYVHLPHNKPHFTTVVISRAHSFPRAAEFRTKRRNLLFSAELWYCHGI